MTNRALVWERAEGRSEMSGRPLDADWWECHHRRPGRQGGTRLPDQHTLANLVALAPGEHNMRPDSIHLDPRGGKALGLLLPSGQGRLSTPRLVPVWWRGREWCYLTDDGLVVPAATVPQAPGGSGLRDGAEDDAGDTVPS